MFWADGEFWGESSGNKGRKKLKFSLSWDAERGKT